MSPCDEILPRGYKNIGTIFSYGKLWAIVQPKYANMKEEALNNKYAPITKKTWRVICKKCEKILKGRLASQRKNRWSQILRTNKISMRHLVALKLYTDFDLLQREFCKTYRAPYNNEVERLQSFFWWKATLQETFEKFSKVPNALNQPRTLFCGINNIMCIDQFDGMYYGPISTTTDLAIARYAFSVVCVCMLS